MGRRGFVVGILQEFVFAKYFSCENSMNPAASLPGKHWQNLGILYSLRGLAVQDYLGSFAIEVCWLVVESMCFLLFQAPWANPSAKLVQPGCLSPSLRDAGGRWTVTWSVETRCLVGRIRVLPIGWVPLHHLAPSLRRQTLAEWDGPTSTHGGLHGRLRQKDTASTFEGVYLLSSRCTLEHPWASRHVASWHDWHGPLDKREWYPLLDSHYRTWGRALILGRWNMVKWQSERQVTYFVSSTESKLEFKQSHWLTWFFPALTAWSFWGAEAILRLLSEIAHGNRPLATGCRALPGHLRQSRGGRLDRRLDVGGSAAGLTQGWRRADAAWRPKASSTTEFPTRGAFLKPPFGAEVEVVVFIFGVCFSSEVTDVV